jgi:NodT family efflux transporter outer membrane factor (OMF) lipoprotein
VTDDLRSGDRLARATWRPALTVAIAIALGGCMIGPDYVRPPAPTPDEWREEPTNQMQRTPADLAAWWTVFGDPALDQLVETAYQQNPTLRAAGTRVLGALARRGIAIGQLFPQQQEAFGAYSRNQLSEHRANTGSGIENTFDDWQFGFDASWELDIWGRLRRGIEAEDAQVLASIATYDDVLVTLVSEVARNYVLLRTAEERLAVARANVRIQREGFDIADTRFKNGAVTELDSAQAASLLRQTEAQIPALEALRRQAENTLCVLLGMSPQALTDVLGAERPIPSAPAAIAIGIPADLLRRRPDVRRAERVLAAQSAEIGIAKSDLLPRLFLVGSISVAAEDFVDLYDKDSFQNFGGPSVRWSILNYGRIVNNVRVQDAAFQALIADYENAVLTAQGEVENAIAGYLGAERQRVQLEQSVAAASRAVNLSDLQYREGAVDYTRVLNSQQFLVQTQDQLVTTKGTAAVDLIALYKALGGGWERRIGTGFVPPDTKRQMEDRTDWGDLIETKEQETDVDAASTGTEHDTGWWRWRRWWPQW